ncbi:MAG TPA: hypothetical protein PLL44_02195 [Novosphingobium sp.]|jgi:VIT1/CCC1 family predicted Fe2+/Mn2+ transporter|nr:hypothetical protein [Novosphingobium sp.]HQN53216.1 hypothetical protein [Novosphingobium sp.]HQQ07461.1 hypothetical protein [Novosphingobium sp.]
MNYSLRVWNLAPRAIGLAVLLCAADPVWAESVGTSVPAPSALTLLALGVTGLLLGRYGSRRPPTD